MATGLGRYNLLVKLGQGGMGIVYLARQIHLRRFCAIKVIHPDLAKDPDAANRFLREARSAAALVHPNLVNIFDCDRFEDRLFLAMEYVEGMSLGEIIRACGALPLPLALGWLHQAAIGLEYIHHKGIIHRDIKPDNLLIDSEGILKIADLGLAKEHLEGDLSMTTTGMIMGSPHYMSPEQINDSKTVDHRTDLYALGITFYQMLKGRLPFSHTSGPALCLAQIQEPIPSLELSDAHLTASLDQIILHLTEKKREARLGSATELVAILKPWLEAYPMNGTTGEFFGRINFAQRTVRAILEREEVAMSTVDQDFSSKPVANAPTAATIPAGSAGSLPKKNIPFWLKMGAVLMAILLILTGWGILAKHKEETKAKLLKSNSSEAPVSGSALTALPKMGGLHVKTDPSCATIFFRADSQNSPAIFKNIPPGSYSVKISLPGYRDKEEKVTIKEDAFTVLESKLEHILGIARIETDPPGAEVIVEGRRLGITPYRLEGGEGDHVQCVLQHPGFEKATLEIDLQQSEQIRRAKLVPLEGPAGKLWKIRNEMETKMGFILDRAIHTEGAQWPMAKKELLHSVEKIIRTHERVSPDAAKEACDALGHFLDRARSEPVEEVTAQREKYVNQMSGIVLKASVGRNGLRPGHAVRR